MKKNLFLCVALAATMPAFSQSMKMVVDAEGNVQGRYVRTNANTYTVSVQDECDIPKAGNRVVVFRAEDGQGAIWCRNYGRVNVRSIPSTKGEIIGKLVYDEDSVPESYDCLGKVDGWYKVRVNGKEGYVRQDLVEWDGICTF